MGRRVILDIEANGLWDADKIWCIVCKDLSTLEIKVFRPKSGDSWHIDFEQEFKEYVKTVDEFIGHNLIGYDIPTINRIMNMNLSYTKVCDTLVLSRLFRPVAPFKEQAAKLKSYDRFGGHGLEAWGRWLGFPKIDFHDYSRFSEELLTYCIQDVNLNHKVYCQLMNESMGFSAFSIKLEHRVAYLLQKQEENGFKLDVEAAKRMARETNALMEQYQDELRKLFPPVKKLVRNYKPLVKKNGSIGAKSLEIIERYSCQQGLGIEAKEDGSYDLYQYEEFNPASGLQIADRLMSIGWKPRKFTDKGNVKTDKDTLEEAIEELKDYPQVEALSKYSIIANRNTKAKTWLELSKLRGDGKVHGRINPIGAGTHRCSHFDDNMANIASVVTDKSKVDNYPDVDFSKLTKFDLFDNNKVLLKVEGDKLEYALRGLDGDFGWDSRSCWIASNNNNCIVGADASGIQLRALAHYMGDAEYTRNLLEGDIHEVNRIAAGIDTRPTAKTFIYAWLLGAGDYKVGTIVGVKPEEYDALFTWGKEVQNPWGQPLIQSIMNKLRRAGMKADRRTVALCLKGAKVKAQFLDRTPALKRLKTEEIPEIAKQGYLLGLDGRKLWIPNEHLAMSLYLQGFEAVIMKMAMHLYSEELESKNIPFMQVAFVHDEFQIETPKECADEVGQAVVRAIRTAGEIFGTECPLDGEYKVGLNWAQTH